MYSVDERHESEVSSHSWCVNSCGYLQTTMKGKKVKQHHYVWFLEHGEWPVVSRTISIDHINRDKSDNRMSNLRLANYSQQRYNSASPSRSLPRGVYRTRNKSNPYRAAYHVDNKPKHLGYYSTVEEAKAARDQAVQQHLERMEQCNQQS